MTKDETAPLETAQIKEAADRWERRQAEEAARAEQERKVAADRQAFLEAQLRRFEEDGRRIEEERARLDRERAMRSSERSRIDEEEKRIEVERVRLEGVAEEEKRRKALDDDAELRRLARQKLEEESRRIEEEKRWLEQQTAQTAAEVKILEVRDEHLEKEKKRLDDLKAQRQAQVRRREEEKKRRQEELLGLVEQIERRYEAHHAVEDVLGGLEMGEQAKPAVEENPRKRRFELCATLLLKIKGETLALPVKNISLSGVLLSTLGHDVSSLELGSEHPIMLFASDNVDNQVDIVAKVARRTEDGIALTWPTDAESTFRLALLIETLPPQPQ